MWSPVQQILNYDTGAGTLPGRHAGAAGTVVPSPADNPSCSCRLSPPRCAQCCKFLGSFIHVFVVVQAEVPNSSQ